MPYVSLFRSIRAAFVWVVALAGLLRVMPARASEVDFNTDLVDPFAVDVHGTTAIKSEGQPPSYWAANAWDASCDASVSLAVEPIEGHKAVAVRNLAGRPSVQFYTWHKVKVAGGSTYKATFEYLTVGSGVFKIDGPGGPEQSLDPTNQKWRPVSLTYSPKGDGEASLLFQNFAVGRDKALFIRNVTLQQSQAPAPVDAAPAAKAASRPLNANDGADLAVAADPVYRALARELAPLGPGRLPFGDSSDALLNTFGFVSADPNNTATAKVVPVEGQPFKSAVEISTPKTSLEWQTLFKGFSPCGVKKGDVLYITFHARVLKSLNEWNKGVGWLYIETDGNRQYQYNHDWTRIDLSAVAGEDDPAGKFNLMFTFGQQAQTLQLGGIAVVNLGPGVDPAKLPHPGLRLDYPGRGADAAWRKEALARIDKIRKATLSVAVTDAAGNPVPNAEVKVDMTRHAFLWGSSSAIGMIPGSHVKPLNDDFARTAGAPEYVKEKYRATFLKLFNTMNAGNTWACWAGADSRFNRADILDELNWWSSHGIKFAHAQVVYPSPEFTAPAAQPLLAGRKAPEFAKAIHDHLIDFGRAAGPYYDSFQIANELEGRPQYTDLLGKRALVDWFVWAKESAPGTRMFINTPPDTNLLPDGRLAESAQFYADTIEYLLANRAPLEGIGFQCHSGVGATPPEGLLKFLDVFAKYKLPLEATEYEMVIPDGNDPEQRRYQADYTRDFLIALFSHPAVDGVILQDFWQEAAWQFRGSSCFFNKDWSINPHGQAYIDLVLNQWMTHATGHADASGRYELSGFLGGYTITATSGSKTKTVNTSLPKAGTVINIRL